MLRSLWSSVPSLVRGGLIIAAVGVVADVTHHVFTEDVHAANVLHIGFVGHTLTLAGMFLALWGVAHAAVDLRRRAREKGGSNAARSSAAAPR